MERALLNQYASNINEFVQTVLTPTYVIDDDYIHGSRRVDLYTERLDQSSPLRVFDYRDENDEGIKGGTYEEALFQRLASNRSSMLVLVGGLGAGKSTAALYVISMIRKRRDAIMSRDRCNCTQPCVRRPIYINCLDIDRTFTAAECELEVLLRIRQALYNGLIDDWFTRGSDYATEDGMGMGVRKVLRRLIIANDLYRWADSESLDFPADLHVPALNLTEGLLNTGPSRARVRELMRVYEMASDSMDRAIERVLASVSSAKRLTALLLRFYLHRCVAHSVRNLLVIDNLDQQPTDTIEQIVNHLHDIGNRVPGAQMLLPLRPSSIVPQGFTFNPDYMYHYGPNCFQMVYHRINKYVLARARTDIDSGAGATRIFASKPSQDEVRCFLTVMFLYATILLGGMASASESTSPEPPAFNPDHDFLRTMRFPAGAIRHLSDTLGAIVGTSGRYASEQLRRYCQHIYARPTLIAGLVMDRRSAGATDIVPPPHGLIVTALLGGDENEIGGHGLANIFRATEFRSNRYWPTLAKVRILAFLAQQGRSRVRSVVRDLAQHGIPVEIAIDALNYLHDKRRLLLWFSRNSDLRRGNVDLDQYVVISEHGRAYMRDLVGDFDYVWFCAQQIHGVPSGDGIGNFVTRVMSYVRLLSDLGLTEWKQLTFARCASGSLWHEETEWDRGEMLTLFVLYSSLLRVLHGARTLKAGRNFSVERAAELNVILKNVCGLIIQWQSRYATYFGGDGFRDRYGELLGESRQAILDLLGFDWIDAARGELQTVHASWEMRAVADNAFKTDLLANSVGDDWQEVWETHAPTFGIGRLADAGGNVAALGAIMRHVFKRRALVKDLLATRVPTYSVVEHNVALLLNEMAVASTAARAIGDAWRLLEWLEGQRIVLEDVRNSLKMNEFRVPDVCAMDEMDELKRRANNLMAAFGRLALSLGAKSAEHLAVRWAL